MTEVLRRGTPGMKVKPPNRGIAAALSSVLSCAYSAHDKETTVGLSGLPQ